MKKKARRKRVCLSDKAKHQVGTYLLDFMDPEQAGMHAIHGSVPVISVAFLQSISRVPQAIVIYPLLSSRPSDSSVQAQFPDHCCEGLGT